MERAGDDPDSSPQVSAPAAAHRAPLCLRIGPRAMSSRARMRAPVCVCVCVCVRARVCGCACSGAAGEPAGDPAGAEGAAAAEGLRNQTWAMPALLGPAGRGSWFSAASNNRPGS